jgi:hypothetical protein
MLLKQAAHHMYPAMAVASVLGFYATQVTGVALASLCLYCV